MGAQRLVAQLVIGDADKSPLAVYGPTHSVCLLALWHLSLDDSPYTPKPVPYEYGGYDAAAPTRLYHWKYAMPLPHCKPPHKVKSFILRADRWRTHPRLPPLSPSPPAVRSAMSMPKVQTELQPVPVSLSAAGAAGMQPSAKITADVTLDTEKGAADGHTASAQGSHDRVARLEASVDSLEGQHEEERVAGMPARDIVQLVDLRGHVFWDREIKTFSTAIAENFARVSMALSDAGKNLSPTSACYSIH